MSDTTAELGLKLAVDADDTADYLVTSLRSSLNVLDGVFSSSTGHNHNGAHQGGNLVFGVLNTTSIAFANGATLGPFATGNQLRFQSTNVSFSGAITVDGASTHTGAATFAGGLTSSAASSFGAGVTVTGLLAANGGINTTNLTASQNATVGGTLNVTGATTMGALTVNGAMNVPGGITVPGTINGLTAVSAATSFTAPDFYATNGWHRNNAASTGLYNNALGLGLRFDSGRAGPIMHGGAYDAARVHGSPHVRTGYFTTPAVAPNGETTISVTFSPAFPAGATPGVALTLLRNTADHMQWRVGLEFGFSGSSTGFTARVRNETGNTEAISVLFLAYWNE
jgi:hypothetical protein